MADAKQKDIELPRIRPAMGVGSELVLTFKSEEQMIQWSKQVGAVLFADNYLLLQGYLCSFEYANYEVADKALKEQPKPKILTISGGGGKPQSFTTNRATGKITRPS